MLKTLLILLIITTIFTFACENNPSESLSNHKPEISEISISPLPAEVDEWIYLTTVATDKDGDNLTYFWSCSAGEFFPGDTNKNPARWKVKAAGIYTITCTVSDGKDTSNKSISVDAK
ncbi:MAG: hypothetical protein GF353_18570 [Candidatus Lokiarchaeota archaeon]|nr:hypothetical protein [Candidatus Lokiarchaeota archaeon]